MTSKRSGSWTWPAAALVGLVLWPCGCQNLLDDLSVAGLCGDGILQTERGEECDDGNLDPGDGCSATCKTEYCGNGIREGEEECDDGADNDNDSDCATTCKTAVCGDGHQKIKGSLPYEVCDDGNTTNGDGCSSDCMLLGRLQVLAGEPGGMGVEDGVGTGARIAGIGGVAYDSTKNILYFTDTNSCAVRYLDLNTGKVMNLFGFVQDCEERIDGSTSVAKLATPGPIAHTGQGLFFGDGEYLRMVSTDTHQVTTCTSYSGKIRAMVAPRGLLATQLVVSDGTQLSAVALPCTCSSSGGAGTCAFEDLAGSSDQGTADGTGTAARFREIHALVADDAGESLYVADEFRVRAMDLSTLQVTTLAGSLPGHKDGVGTAAEFELVTGIALQGTDLYTVEASYAFAQDDLSKTENYFGWGTLRKIGLSASTLGKVETIAGARGDLLGSGSYESDGYGFLARFLAPRQLVSVDDLLLIGEGASIRTYSLQSMAMATAAGQLVKDLDFWGISQLVAGNDFFYFIQRGRHAARFPIRSSAAPSEIPRCQGMGQDADAMTIVGSSIYVAESKLGGICRTDYSKTVGAACADNNSKAKCSVVATPSDYSKWGVVGLAVDGDDIYIVDGKNGALYHTKASSKTVDKVSGLSSKGFHAVTLADKKLWLTVPVEHQVMTYDLKTKTVQHLGNGKPESIDGKGSAAAFCRPLGITSNEKNVFVGEGHCDLRTIGTQPGHRIRQIDLATGTLSTLLGPGVNGHVDEGVGTGVGVTHPTALGWDDKSGVLIVADTWENAILEVD
jgi:cysteine-rich repeat protein